MPPKKKAKQEGEKNLVWTDDEIQLLLETVLDFKTEKSYESIDWESIKTKYEKIRENFVQNLPETKSEEYPHDAALFTRDRISNKTKKICADYRKALDTGRKSGGGRVVAFFYDLCSEIWTGCPATESMDNGIDGSQDPPENKENEPADSEAISEVENETISVESEISKENTEEDGCGASADLGQQKAPEEQNTPKPLSSRQKMKDMLENRRDKKITKTLKDGKGEKKISEEAAAILKRMSDQDKIFNEQLKDFQQNMRQFTETMTSTFAAFCSTSTVPTRYRSSLFGPNESGGICVI